MEYSLGIDGYRNKNGWIEEWSVLYWGWVICWSGFIGGLVGRV
ncbi:BCCT family transporter [Staphylococcus hominis]|nr:BCCT family transporter [Staphylococcus hominis]